MEAEFCLWGHIMENSIQIGRRNTLCLTDAVAVTFFLDANTLILPREAIHSVSGDITPSQDALALSVPT